MTLRWPLLGALAVLACAPPPAGPPSVVPEFALLDTNPTSPSAGRLVRPSDQRGKVSAWYFGHAT